MAGTYTLVAKRFFIAVHSFVVVLFLLVCLIPYVDVSQWWWVSMLGLGFAFLFLLLVIAIFFWALIDPKYILLSLLPLALGYKSIAVLVAVNPPATFRYQKPPTTLRVLSWNVARFLELKRNNNPASQKRQQMFDLIKQQGADVLCFQEFFHSTDSTLYNNIDPVKALGYPYYYYCWESDGDKQWFGQAIFSRYPIVDSGLLHYPRPGQPETLLHADVLVGRDTVRFFTTHLQSVKFQKQDYQNFEEIKNREDSLLQNSRNIFYKLKRGIVFRAQQADIVKEQLSRSPHPVVITGDFNDVPNSYTYFKISEGLQDPFLKRGFGIGRTFASLSSTLRIDHILVSPQFDVLQFNRQIRSLSDHYMIVADLKLRH
ncbi:MAG TPA: endonuclease/exonuclease/phosphatase family protein [Chitinophagaceae bacterium]|nr:endonuclease/exonuclease/phosphatase family protein [Chitinophagaceae bacterium]